MIVLTASGIRKSFGVEHVLKDVSFALSQGERLGLVGVNGSGKTTLLKIIAGILPMDGGSLALQKGMELGYLAQSYEPAPGSTVLQEMEKVFAPLYALETRMRELEQLMGEEGQDLERLGNEYAKVLARFEAADGYSCHSRVQGVLQGLGFTKAQQEQQAAKLSGGELTRLTLGRLLLQKPDLLLLDEPTNHLDLQALQWLEEYLNEYRGAVILVSHDRYFLDRVCTGMVELLFGVAEQYRGNYTRYMEQREERFLSRTRAWEQQQKEIARQQAIIARYRSFNREKSIRAAESREKALDRMELLDKPTEEKQAHFRFRAYGRIGDEALKIEGLTKGFGERVLFEDIHLLLHAGERAVLIGPNGVGKTTMLECLVGRQKADRGRYLWGANADMGYYEQKHQSLPQDATVLRAVWDDFPRLLQHEVRGALGLFLFSGDDVFKPVSALSGGEKARVALTRLMLRHNNFLLLDEPTNHLDSDSREALEEALLGYEGTILAVSHDRYFINRIADRILVMDQQGIRSFEGNYDDYLRQLEREQDPECYADEGRTRTEVVKERRREKQAMEEEAALRAAVQAAEEQAARAEDQLKALQDELMDPDVYSDPDRAAQAGRAIRAQEETVTAAFLRWEQAEEALQAHLEDG